MISRKEKSFKTNRHISVTLFKSLRFPHSILPFCGFDDIKLVKVKIVAQVKTLLLPVQEIKKERANL